MTEELRNISTGTFVVYSVEHTMIGTGGALCHWSNEAWRSTAMCDFTARIRGPSISGLETMHIRRMNSCWHSQLGGESLGYNEAPHTVYDPEVSWLTRRDATRKGDPGRHRDAARVGRRGGLPDRHDAQEGRPSGDDADAWDCRPDNAFCAGASSSDASLWPQMGSKLWIEVKSA